jgi:hypothetical protein
LDISASALESREYCGPAPGLCLRMRVC